MRITFPGNPWLDSASTSDAVTPGFSAHDRIEPFFGLLSDDDVFGPGGAGIKKTLPAAAAGIISTGSLMERMPKKEGRAGQDCRNLKGYFDRSCHECTIHIAGT